MQCLRWQRTVCIVGNYSAQIVLYYPGQRLSECPEVHWVHIPFPHILSLPKFLTLHVIPWSHYGRNDSDGSGEIHSDVMNFDQLITLTIQILLCVVNVFRCFSLMLCKPKDRLHVFQCAVSCHVCQHVCRITAQVVFCAYEFCYKSTEMSSFSVVLYSAISCSPHGTIFSINSPTSRYYHHGCHHRSCQCHGDGTVDSL